MARLQNVQKNMCTAARPVAHLQKLKYGSWNCTSQSRSPRIRVRVLGLVDVDVDAGVDADI